MLEKLSWRTLEQRRTDTFHKIIYVAVPLPGYVFPHTRPARSSHSLAYRVLYRLLQILILPFHIGQWNYLPASVAALTDLDSFRSCQSGNPLQALNARTPLFLSCIFPYFRTLMRVMPYNEKESKIMSTCMHIP